WSVISRLSTRNIRDVSDLMFFLFEAFWALGWSVGVATLGALTVVTLFYDESARLQNGRLVYVPRLGPLKIIIEYDLARLRNIRVDNAGSRNEARIRFDDDEGSHVLGDTMLRLDAETLVDTIQRATVAAGAVTTLRAPVPGPPTVTVPRPHMPDPPPAT